MPIIDVKSFMCIIKWHNQRYVLDSQMMFFAEHIDKTFTHIAIDATLDWIIDRRHTAFYLKKNIK